MICRLCGSDDVHLAYTQGDCDQYRFFRCRRCRLVNYDLAGGLDQGKYADVPAPPHDESARTNKGSTVSYHYLARHAPVAGRLLDIGCGNGRLLYLATRDGWQATGLELSEELARRVREWTGCPVLVMSFLDRAAASIPGAPFDVVVLRHVLEHLPDTRLALMRIRDLLAPGGLALLEFPNIDAWDARAKRWMRRRGLARKRYRADYVPGHCNEFCHEAFRFAARSTGLRVLDWRTYSHRPVVSAIHGALGSGNKARALVTRSDAAQSSCESPVSISQSSGSTSSGGSAS